MRGPEDGNEDDQESVSFFLTNKTFNHYLVFIYISFQDSRPYSDPSIPLRYVFKSFLRFR